MSTFTDQYRTLWERICNLSDSHEVAVGGDFETVGVLEFSLLRMFGLNEHSKVVDVGCGSGRLAVQLAPFLVKDGGYIGTDILPQLLEKGRLFSGRDDWTFSQTNGHSIPAPSDWADFVCFFSVMTHINHEASWQYVLEAKRVLKPGGHLVCSFLEFRIRSHWWIFKNTFADKSPDKILNQFISRDAFEAFAFNAGLDIVSFHDGDKPHIPIDRELKWKAGVTMTEMGNLGQSVCVLRKPLVARELPL